jgi:DNA-binding NtrC family response regulator
VANILLVEDDPDVRLVVEHVLLDAGHGVDATENVAGGKECLACREYDLVLTDGRLPDGTGMELADNAAEKHIPALIITGYAFILRELAADPTRYRVLLKPLRPNELVEAVAQALADPSQLQST